ncbi:MAG: uncharacterized protein KVP18_001493 [Porospora cf. gigantea A]|uniref:uncharacterized protein n=1 Tax=Porospora cf. gigantea A TaxID=2853593 RepID=UPI00355A6291|nr:MAG: hypothetical protein KVP18_001493 [Porospora cf. gigantea A]
MDSRENKRLLKELRDMTEAEDDMIFVETVDNDLYHWRARIHGPHGTVYEGGIFDLDIMVPEDYPYQPPRIQFDTKVWHPNVSSQTGMICLDILKAEWSPALTIRTTLLSIQALLSCPEPDEPQDAEVAAMFRNHKSLFDSTARSWTASFAQPLTQKVQLLLDMGFDEAAALEALKRSHGDHETAINSLLAG